MAQLKERGLRRSVGVPGLFATAYGNVGSSIYYALGLVAAHALGLTPLVFIFAGGLFALTAKTYAEGASMFPEAGGSSSFARHAFNEVVSFFAGWGLSLDYIITVAISAFFVPHYLSVFLPALGHGPGDVIGGAAVIAILALLNIRGIGESTRLNIFLAITDLLTQIALVVLGTVLILDPALLVQQIHLGVAPSYGQLLFAVSISMIAYTGIETVSNMAEEARDPGRDVPRTVNYVLFAVLGIFAGISIVSIVALPVTQDAAGHYSTQLGTTYKDDPVLGIVSALHLHGAVETAARYYIGVLAATILIIATNAGLIGISRLSWSLSEHRQLPGAFCRLHERYRTPWFTIAFFSVIAMILLIPGETDFLGNLYSFGAMLSFTVAHISIIALRLRDPGRDRPYRAPWNVSIRGKPVPLTAVLGALGTGAAFVSVVVLHDEARYVGTAWMVAGMAGYFLYRRRQGLDPRERYRIERPERPLGFYGVAYHSALVPMLGTDVSTEAMSRAAKLVGPDAEVEALYVLKVPQELELGAGMEDEEARARSVLEVARLQARARRLKVRVRLIRTRNPGAAIVEEARDRHSDLVYISTEHAPNGERLLGPTTRYVLANRPCRVVVEGGNAAPQNGRPDPGADGWPRSPTSTSAPRHTPPVGETPQLLEDLLRAPAPSGYEGPASDVWRQAASFASLTTDALGSSVARIGADSARPLLAVVGHIDEIGLVVTHVDEKGFLYFAPIGGWDAQILIGQRVQVESKGGAVPGVIGRKPIHLLKDEQRKKVVELREMHIDIGAADEDDALARVRVGDPVVVAADPVRIGDGRLVSRSLDNRLGVYVALEALRRVHERGDLKGQMAAVAAVQEEIGSKGATTTAFSLEPDLALAVDVTHATDAPGVEEKEVGRHPLGSGPVIGRGATLSPRVFELLSETAERMDAGHTIEASGRATWTDADAFQISRAGIPTGLISIPLRYMHSPVELVDLADVDATIELIAAFAASLEPGLDLSR